ncbi:MAG: hypothetical protein CL608_15250 [Anaerolineaceae bacterium]|nr:hypothetical protein [Anaerolineaceae bacterium]
MTTNQPRSAGGRLWWVIRTTFVIFIVVAVVAVVLGGLGYAGYLGVQEIQRSTNSLSMRIDANEQNLNSLRDLVNSEFAEGNPEQTVQINQLENELALLTEQLEALQAAQTADTAVQTEQLGTVEAELATAVAQNSELSGELATVQEALVALQSDLNSSGSRIDELGGDVDRLRLQLGALDEAVTELTEVTTVARSTETADLQQTLTLLQLWGVLTNARLALMDGDDVAAETAVTRAMTLAGDLTAGEDTPAAAALTRLQTRLDLAAAGFATDLPMVAQDLEAASQELTLLLAGPASEAEIVEATPTATETAETNEETATATPLPSPTAPPTVTPTPTP